MVTLARKRGGRSPMIGLRCDHAREIDSNARVSSGPISTGGGR